MEDGQDDREKENLVTDDVLFLIRREVPVVFLSPEFVDQPEWAVRIYKPSCCGNIPVIGPWRPTMFYLALSSSQLPFLGSKWVKELPQTYVPVSLRRN